MEKKMLLNAIDSTISIWANENFTIFLLNFPK